MQLCNSQKEYILSEEETSNPSGFRKSGQKQVFLLSLLSEEAKSFLQKEEIEILIFRHSENSNHHRLA